MYTWQTIMFKISNSYKILKYHQIEHAFLQEKMVSS